MEFVLSHNELCELAKHKSPPRTQPSYLTETFDAEDEDEGFFIEILKDFHLMAAGNLEIPNDLCMGNIIDTCLSYDYAESLSERANMLLDMIFSQPLSPHYTSMLMGLFNRIKDMGTPLLSYAKFFESAFNDEKTRFSNDMVKTIWAYQRVPVNGGENNTLCLQTKERQEEFGQVIAKLDCYSTMLDYFMEEDKKVENKDKTGIPQQSSYIDIREITLQKCIQDIMEKGEEHDESLDMDFTIHDFSELLRDVHTMFGENIDEQPQVKNCIDAVFVKYSWIMKLQFLLFFCGYFVPFLVQLFFSRHR